MTQEPGATKTLSTILRNSATISTQQVLQLQQELENLKQVVEQQQLELMKLRSDANLLPSPDLGGAPETTGRTDGTVGEDPQ